MADASNCFTNTLLVSGVHNENRSSIGVFLESFEFLGNRIFIEQTLYFDLISLVVNKVPTSSPRYIVAHSVSDQLVFLFLNWLFLGRDLGTRFRIATLDLLITLEIKQRRIQEQDQIS